MWRGRVPANKYHWHVWRVLTVYGPYWVCPSLWWHLLSGSTLLRLQVALQGYCLKWAQCFVHFPGLSSLGSGSWVLHKGTDSGVHFVSFPGPTRSGDQVLCEHTVPGGPCILIKSLVLTARFPGCTTKAPSLVCRVSPLGN